MTQMEMHHIGLVLNGILERNTMDFVIMQKGKKNERLNRQTGGD